jgi:septal ring factor EnvC (AmiA/AmiB activator)
MKWFIVIWILLGWSFYPVTSNLFAARVERVEKDLSEKKEELKRIKKKLRLKQKEKEAILRKESSIRKSLDRAQRDLHRKERVLKQKKAELDRIKRSIRDTESRISILAMNVKQTEDKLGSGLQAIYKMSQVAPEAYLFSMSSSADLLKMDKYLRVLVAYHVGVTNTCRHELALRRGDERRLVKNRIQMLLSISEEGKKKERVRKVRNMQQASLQSTVNQKVICEKSITEMERRGKLIQSLIDRLMREKRILSYGIPKDRMPKGNLQLPVQGRVVGLFKERGANGIEIEAPIGAPVQAILSGKVVYADWFKGFGNLIIIDHGDGIFTISGNCSNPIKKSGDTVSKGEIIAELGNPESDGDSRLYFEIRYRGKPQDPLDWILSSKTKHH